MAFFERKVILLSMPNHHFNTSKQCARLRVVELGAFFKKNARLTGVVVLVRRAAISGKQAYKPGSVESYHLSGTAVTDSLLRPTHRNSAEALRTSSPRSRSCVPAYLAFQPVRFAMRQVLPLAR